jgi:THO complex subunit 4
VEIIVDDIDVAPSPPIPLAPSLLDRIGVKRSTEAIPIDSTTVNTAKISTCVSLRLLACLPYDTAIYSTSAKHLVSPKHPNRPITHTVPLQRARQKKGPKRIKKSLAQLDKEIEDYRASAEMFVAGVMNGESL